MLGFFVKTLSVQFILINNNDGAKLDFLKELFLEFFKKFLIIKIIFIFLFL